MSYPYVAFVPIALYEDPAKRRIVAHEPAFTRHRTFCGLTLAPMTFMHRDNAPARSYPCKSCRRALASRA